MAKGICSIDGCESKRHARELCTKHYQRWKKFGRTDLAPTGPSTCKVEGCARPCKGWGWCKVHYARWRKTGDVQAHIPVVERRTVCIVQDCDRPRYARDYCDSHYHRVQQGGDVGDAAFRAHGRAKVRDELGRKQCHVCDRWLHVENFHADANQSDGLATRCRECKRWDKILSNFGITRQRYEAMLAAQAACCAICGDSPPVLCIDHDHRCCPAKGKSCGKCVRALLCGDCNRSIGMMKDDPAVLRAAADYLERDHTRTQPYPG